MTHNTDGSQSIGLCGGCGKPVAVDGNWVKAKLWASTASFHWPCLTELMTKSGPAKVEDATWRATHQARS